MTVPLPAAYDALRDPYMHDLGVGTTRDMKSVVTGVFVPYRQFREYTLGEKVNLWRGKFFSMRMLRDQAFSTDLTERVTELAVPVYFFSGRYDYTVNYTLSKKYFEKLQAPVKGFYTFEQSAHSPMFEEPEKVQRILLEDVLAGANSLADR
jgi:pimeloyl-ACP methyl ester carboxylesterase